MSIGNVRIIGSGVINGGSYANISITGSGRIIGPVEAEHLSITGSAEAEREIRCRKLSVTGSAELKSVEAQEAEIAGSIEIDGEVTGGTLKVSGSAEVSQTVRLQRVLILGSMECKGELVAEEFVSRGAFEAQSVNANDIQIKLGGLCTVGEMGAARVWVQYALYHHPIIAFLSALFWRTRKRELRAEEIEADDIYLENTIAHAVRGNNVSIARGSRVNLVEYRDKVWIDPRAIVDKVVKV